MAGGSHVKERATDQQCPKCDRWYGAQGYSAHVEHCDGDPDDGPSESHIFDPSGDHDGTTMTDTDTETTDDDGTELVCPECDGTDDIVDSETAIRLFADAGKLTDKKRGVLESYDYYHNDAGCMAVFTEDEL